MKDYMLVFVGADYGAKGMSAEEIQKRMGSWFSWIDKLSEKGVYKSGEALLAPAKRVTSADLVTVDGPAAESKELIGGYFIVSANDMEEAISYCADFPDYDLDGEVEVREVAVYN